MVRIRLAGPLAAVSSARVVSLVAAAVQLPLLARELTATEFALSAAAIAASSYVSLLSAEAPSLAFQRFALTGSRRQNFFYARNQVAVGVLVVAVIGLPVASVLGYGSFAAAALGWGIGLGTMRLVSTAWLMWDRAWAYAAAIAVSTSARTIGLLALVYSGVAIAWSIAIAGLVSAAIGLGFAPRGARAAPANRKRRIPWQYRFGLSLAITSGSIAVITNLDQIALPHLVSQQHAAEYAAMVSAALLSVGAVLSLIATAVYPQLQAMWVAGNRDAADRGIDRLTVLFGVLSVAAGMVCVAAGSPLMHFVFGGHYSNPPLASATMISNGVFQMALAQSWKYTLLLRARSLVVAAVAATFAHIVALAVLTALFGTPGAAAATILGFAAYAAVIELGVGTDRRLLVATALVATAGIVQLDGSRLVALLAAGAALVAIGPVTAATLRRSTRADHRVAPPRASEAELPAFLGSRVFLVLVGVAYCGAFAVALALGRSTATLAVLGVLGVALAFILGEIGSATLTVPAFVVLFLASGSSVLPAAALSYGCRALSAALIVAVVGAVTAARRPAAGRVGSALGATDPWQRFVIGTTVLLLIATVPYGYWLVAVVSLVGAAVLFLICQLPARGLGPVLRRTTVSVLLVILAVSLVLGVVAPSIGLGVIPGTNGLLADRLRGLASNPNLLGCYAFVAGSLLVLLPHRLRTRVIGFAIVVAVLLWTASRTSAVALIAVLVIAALRGVGAARRVVAVLIGAAALALVLSAHLFDAQPLLRTEDTRSQSLSSAIDALHTSLLGGSGINGIEVEIASSPLRAIVAAGLPGLLILVGTLALLIRDSFRASPATGALAVGFAVYSLGEAWMLSLTGPIVFLFTIAWLGVRDAGARTDEPAPTPPVTRRRRPVPV